MPTPQLLSPAGLPALSDVFIENGQEDGNEDTPLQHAGPSSSSILRNVSGAAAHAPSYLSIDAAHGGLPAHLSKRRGGASRAPLKRTASTSSVNEHVMDMLNPYKQKEEIARLNNNVKRRRGGSPGGASSSSSTIDGNNELSEDDDETEVNRHDSDPFSNTMPVSGPPSMLLDSGGSGDAPGAIVDGLSSSSPTSRASAIRNHTRFASRGTTSARASNGHNRSNGDEDMDMDDADNNPFLTTTTSRQPPKAPSKKEKTGASHKDKISYVFRGKRITYDAPLESLFSNDADLNDPDEVALNRRLKSGPRVLFPSPPAPAPAPASSDNISHLMATPSRRTANNYSSINTPPTSSTAHAYGHRSRPSINMHLMQTPRRQPVVQTRDSEEMQSDDLEAAIDSKGDDNGERKPKEEDRGGARLIPPTPASLPQKSKEQRQIERERLQNAMRGIQAAHQASHTASSRGGVTGGMYGQQQQQQPRRYAPYPPR